MKVPIRSLLLFNLDLPGIFFFFSNYYETKGICCRGGRRNFSKEQNIPKTGSGRGVSEWLGLGVIKQTQL